LICPAVSRPFGSGREPTARPRGLAGDHATGGARIDRRETPSEDAVSVRRGPGADPSWSRVCRTARRGVSARERVEEAAGTGIPRNRLRGGDPRPDTRGSIRRVPAAGASRRLACAEPQTCLPLPLSCVFGRGTSGLIAEEGFERIGKRDNCF